jgi:hypothetical protein
LVGRDIKNQEGKLIQVNESVIVALKQAVANANQPKNVAEGLIAWLDAIATGSADITFNSDAATRIAYLIDQIQLTLEEPESEIGLGEDL